MRIPKRQYRIVISLLSAASLGLLLSGCGGNSDNAAPASPAGGPGGPGGPGGRTSRSGPGGPGGMPGSPPTGMMPTGGAPVQTASASTAPPKNTAMPSHRNDPFAKWWRNPPPPPKPLPESYLDPRDFLPAVRTAVSITGGNGSVTEEIKRREAPRYRMVGAMTSGNGIFALLDNGDPDGQKVVKPGDTLEGYTVISINSDSVLLEKKVGKEVIQQIIPQSDKVPAAQGGSGASPRGSGFNGPGGYSGYGRSGGPGSRRPPTD